MAIRGNVDKIQLSRETFAPGAMSVIRKVASIAERMGMDVYLVGGTVRDMLIGRRSDDIDIVTEGSAIELGKALADNYALDVREYPKFGTCTLMFPHRSFFRLVLGDIRVDIAMAREETYSSPGALPGVRPSSIATDLARRDFTVNAMAIGITEKSSGILKDFCGGVKDVERGIIRILHDNSFLDDPARIFRAARFETRFSFTIEEHTAALLKQAVNSGMIRCMRESRIREEWALVGEERLSKKCITTLEGLLGSEMRFVRELVRGKGDLKK